MNWSRHSRSGFLTFILAFSVGFSNFSFTVSKYCDSSQEQDSGGAAKQSKIVAKCRRQLPPVGCSRLSTVHHQSVGKSPIPGLTCRQLCRSPFVRRARISEMFCIFARGIVFRRPGFPPTANGSCFRTGGPSTRRKGRKADKLSALK